MSILNLKKLRLLRDRLTGAILVMLCLQVGGLAAALPGLFGVGGTLVSQVGIVAPTRDLDTGPTAFVSTLTRAPVFLTY